MPVDPKRVQTVFLAAVEATEQPVRAAILDRHCGTNPELRRRVEALLAAHDKPGTFPAGAASDWVVAGEHPPGLNWYTVPLPLPSRPADGPGTVIGPYKLLEQIGEGGFGIVFMAEQTSPVRRRVALKVLKPGMDTRHVVARFEAERQALALMEHPHIARVFDAGETPSGRPYFVMELVRGESITDFCDQKHLRSRERLDLFLCVCQAVQHAHHKGIIHRDLKPSNILVTLHDGTPVVKVIDFGIAKALGEQLTEKTLFTGFAQMVGTPRYMSPEQAERSGLDIDTRTDVYTLGVLLYELLTGTTPLDRERLNDADYDEVRRLIREDEPPPPSTRISTLGLAATVVCAQRDSDPKSLRQLVQGELDWIVLKALEKDRNRRYESASAFAADVERYLRDEPVLACPPSRWYRFRKFARRNKFVLATTAMVAVTGLMTIAGLAASNALIRQEQTRTRDEKTRAEQAQRLAEERAEQIRRDLRNLTAANTLLEQGRWYASETCWDDAYAAFTKAIDLRPDHASLRAERGDLLALLGLWDLAAADFAREMQLRRPDVAFRYYLHALLRRHVGDGEGFRLARSQMRERFFGTTNTTFAREVQRACVMAPDPDGDPVEVVRRCENLLADSPQSSHRLYLLGTALYRAGRFEPAVERLRESLDAPPDLSAGELAYPVLAMAHHGQGQAAQARQALEAAAKTIDRWTQDRYEAQGGRWVTHRGAAALWPIAWWDWLEHELYFREAKELIDGVPPPDDPRLLVLRARAFAGLRWDAKASTLYAEAQEQWPDDSRIRLEAHRSRGYIFVALGRLGDAAAEFAQASELAGDDSELWRFRAVALLGAGEQDAYHRVCQAMIERFGKTDDSRTACNVLFACVLDDDALAGMAQLTGLAEVAAPYFHFGSYVRGAALYRAGRHEEAVECFHAAAKIYRRGAWECSFLAMAEKRLGHMGEARRALAEAGRWIEDANRGTGDDVTGARATWGGWPERVVFPLLLREAERVVGAKQDE